MLHVASAQWFYVIHMEQNPKAHNFYNFKLDYKLVLHFKTGRETQVRVQL